MGSDFDIVTTFHREGYEKYGERMVETFVKYWPKQTHLTCYYEDMSEPLTQYGNVSWRSFEEEVGERYNAFAKIAEPYELKVLGPDGEDPRSHRDGPVTPGSRYLFEATRFSHKYYTVDDFREKSDARYIVWCDADVVAKNNIPYDFLESIVEEGKLWSRVNRPRVYPECGFMIWDKQNQYYDRYFQLMKWLYDEGALFKLEEWHDSYVWWAAEKYVTQEAGRSVSFDLGDGSTKHPFVTGILGQYLDHLKGNRKDTGYSPERIS
jgi:hypothetical protein